MRYLAFALAMLLATSAGAQDMVSAQAFVTRLYEGYSHAGPRGPDYLGRQAATVFAPSLLRLIRRDAAETPRGDVGALDGDPICDCQDSAGLKLTSLKLTPGAKERATAAVSLRFAGGETDRLRLDLIWTPAGWRVADVHSAVTPSLAAYLRRHAGGR